MATKKQIIDEIITRVNNSKIPDYTAWRIGLTHDIETRYKYWGEPMYFLFWEADSLSDAQAIETYFINTMNMKGGTGGNLDSNKITYVYIF